ncbi:AAC(3) family N-acetyltransferase [Nocardia grenadensis]|uniref:AAC(3) family N-acetyltransferase n=1 Tax=Nocardia grenadensis TaxID=931537 RepID=UPI0012EDF86A
MDQPGLLERLLTSTGAAESPPHVSFALWGADAAAIVGGHELSISLGEGSPLARSAEKSVDPVEAGPRLAYSSGSEAAGGLRPGHDKGAFLDRLKWPV